MTAVDCPLPYGYALSDVHGMAHAAVKLAGRYASDYTDRLDAAYGAIVIALYEAPHWPQRHDLVRTGAAAISRMVEADLRHRGYRDRNAFNGGGSAPRFAAYWWGANTTPSPEERVVNRVAAAQVLALLSPTQLSAVAALAVTGDHAEAVTMLDVPRGTYVARLGRARRIVLTWWHEGETPRKPPIDRRSGPRRPRATHCRNGHERTPDNVYRCRGRADRCRQCVQESQARGRARKKAPDSIPECGW